MRNGRIDNDPESALEAFRDQMRNLAEAQRKRAQLTAKATSRGKRITVTVNANGVVIDTKFAKDISDLSYDEIAKTVTQLAQQAANDVLRMSQELLAPMAEQRMRLPKLTDLIEDLPDFVGELPQQPAVSTAPPSNSRSLATEGAEDIERPAPMEFAGAERLEDSRRDGPARSATDTGW